jgi:hypothetical protein
MLSAMRFQRLSLALALAATLTACKGSGPRIPPGVGLRAADRTPPADAMLYERPRWTNGDELHYRRGGRIELSYSVERVEGGYRLIDVNSGRKLALDDDLAMLGELSWREGEFRVRLDPLDPSYAWPLWVGKRWTGEYTMRETDGASIPIEARYHCDAVEQVTVPAGTFRCLRVWRRDRVALPGDFVERTTVDWYAPEVGYVVRRLEDGMDMVLVEHLGQGSIDG